MLTGPRKIAHVKTAHQMNQDPLQIKTLDARVNGPFDEDPRVRIERRIQKCRDLIKGGSQ